MAAVSVPAACAFWNSARLEEKIAPLGCERESRLEVAHILVECRWRNQASGLGRLVVSQ
jgi:hypothetical protein